MSKSKKAKPKGNTQGPQMQATDDHVAKRERKCICASCRERKGCKRAQDFMCKPMKGCRKTCQYPVILCSERK